MNVLGSACAQANQVVTHSKLSAPADVADLLAKATDRLRKALKSHDIGGDRSRASWYALTTAVEEGFSDKEIEALILAHASGVGERYLSDQAQLRPETKTSIGSEDTDLPSGFRRSSEGRLFYRRGPNEPCVLLSSPLRVIARTRDYDENNWGRLVEIVTPTNEKRQIYIAAADLHVNSGAYLYGRGGLTIGDHVLVGQVPPQDLVAHPLDARLERH